MKPFNQRFMTCKANKKRRCVMLLVAGLTLGSTSLANARGDDGFSLQENETSRIIQHEFLNDYLQHPGNVSIIQQQGNNNQAHVVQSRSQRYQYANWAHIHQEGNENQASIKQSGGNNIGLIWQKGDNHTATIEQQGNSNSVSFEASINQTGYNSNISISQSGSGLRGVSVQQQTYSGNPPPVTIRTY